MFVAEEYCRNNHKLAEVEALSRAEVEKSVGSLKQENYELSEKFKEAEKGRKSAEAGLKNAETQAKDQCQKLFVTETNLATERQTVLDLKATLQKAVEEVRLAKEEAQLIREAAKAEKKASYKLGPEETEARLSEELPEVCRDYCSISWAHDLNATGVPADSALRLPEKVFFPHEIREIPDCGTEASEQATVVPDAIPLVDKAKDPAKESVSKGFGADSQAKDVSPPQPEQKENPPDEA